MTIMTDKKKTILEAVEKLTDTYRKEELFWERTENVLPNKKEIINFIKDMRSISFSRIFQCGFQCQRVSGALCGISPE